MSYQERFNAWEKARYAPPPEPDLSPFAPTLSARVPMRDGVTLYTEVFCPGGALPGKGLPVILSRSPYPYSRPSRNDKRPLSRYMDAGFVVVFQLTRGQGLSDGVFHFFKDDINDGYDTIEWIASQPWCDGNVGMEGSSYVGGTQLLAAKTGHPALKCIMPTAFIGNFTRLFPYCNGVPMRSMYLQWHKVADLESWDDLDAAYGDIALLHHPLWGPAFKGKPLIEAGDKVLSGDKLAAFKEGISHPLDDAYWQDLHFTDEQLAALDIPIFFTDGWYDATIGPIDFFSRLEKIQPDNPNRYLLVGPWNHAQTYSAHLHEQSNGARKMPASGAADLVGQRLAFFTRYLKNDSSSKVQSNRVRVFITGAEDPNANIWLDLPTFPAPGTQLQTWYLHSQGDARSFPGDGGLSGIAPMQETPDQYVYDPGLPTPCEVDSLCDRREIEIRSDVLTYTSDALEQPLTILGEMTLVLHAASNCLDTDWFAQLTEVFPDGRSIAFHCALSALRARYRQGLQKEVLLTPNQAEVFTLSLGPAGHQIAKGNRLRLSLSSANFPLCDTNTNTGNEVTTDVDSVIATQTVYHDSLRPSHIILPTIVL